ncbi:MAG TPA: TlpA disulfide reductase family protein [Actinomycetota bacterium]|nr:TlpA disulfide reductase family protein [Actinomycetota bacterium]
MSNGATDRRCLALFRLSAVAAAVLIVAAACSGASSGQATPPSGALLPKTPDALPQFSPAQFRQLLAQLRGRPVVVNIWASWCRPCIVEAPHLAAAAREFAGRAQFIGVDVLDRRAPARDFIRKYQWSYPSVFDPTAAIRDDLGFVGQPVTMVLDASGSLVFSQSGPITLEILRKELMSL